MTTELQTTKRTPALVLEQLRHSLLSPQEWNAKEVALLVNDLTKPAPPTWLMAHIAALLLPYYEKDTPAAIREIDAEYWARSLRQFPAWAIHRAIAWWRSADNPKRNIRPVEGNIEARAIVEMDAVNAAQRWLEIGRAPGSGPALVSDTAKEDRITAERANEIVKMAGFPVRKFGGADNG